MTTVVQARLHRTRSDLVALAPLLPQVRICKGIYPEPAGVAYTDPEAIRRNYLFCLDTLLESGGYAAIATHDEAVIVSSLERLARHGRLRRELVRVSRAPAAGHRLRVTRGGPSASSVEADQAAHELDKAQLP